MPCSICGLSYDQHAEAWGIVSGIMTGTINNCARTNGQQDCQMCSGGCYPVHRYTEEDLTPKVIDRFAGEYAFLSNFYPSHVVIYDWTFPSVEHAFQAMKSCDPAGEWVWFTRSDLPPGRAKKMGRSIRCRQDWESVKVPFMRALVWDKFTRHQDLLEKLCATNNAWLVEGNTWGDKFWGVCDGVGENWLGKILMETRDYLPF